MKIGILSMQRVMNYGSFLQAFALKTTLEQLGHTCEFIDIEQGRIFKELNRSIPFFMKKVFERFAHIDVFTRLKYTRTFQGRFKNEFFSELGIANHTVKHFDAVVIGSDEVFNFAQRTPWGYTPQLYGKIANADKVISYAGSFGHTTMRDIEYFKVKKELMDAMTSMSAISVRDTNSFDIVKALTARLPIINVDPVLMFPYDEYVKQPKEKDYMIVYTYPNRIKDKEEIDAIKSFARKYNKKLISIGFYFPWCDATVVPHPFEVLGYMKYADYVVTDTFHGSVMSLKFSRHFAALVRSSNKQKMTSLLKQFSLDNRIVENPSQLEEKLLKESNYEFVNDVLRQERQRSLDYLTNNL